MIWVVHPRPDPEFLLFTHPGSGFQKDTESRIRMRNADVFVRKETNFTVVFYFIFNIH